MARQREGLQDERTRVSLFLPTETQGDVAAVREVLEYLQQQHESKTCSITGFTQSTFPNSPFWGVWWDDGKWTDPEKVSVVIVDYDKQMGSKHLEDGLRRLKKAVHNSYKNFGRKQKVIWITAQPIMRFA